MRVLVVGGGGREHAIVWKLARHGHQVYCAPGNAGIRRQAECIPVSALDVRGLVRLAREKRVELTVVGPEAPLVAGLADELRREGLAVLGPGRDGACLEGDKAFAKRVMLESGIPTARCEVFDDYELARGYVLSQQFPVVIKATGLAAGKGVVVACSAGEAEQVLTEMMVAGKLGAAGRQVVVEEYLEGEEVSAIGLCDGMRVKLLVPSQDHKRLQDGDLGPNTGGMGAYAPAPVVEGTVLDEVEQRVFRPLLVWLNQHGIEYRGVIYAGLMLTDEGVKVLEFNCRFGDPETQVVLPLLDEDLGELAMACCEGRLDRMVVRTSRRWALCVVIAARGYPGSYMKGQQIELGLDESDDVVLFHAGTALEQNRLVTAGGRVLGVTGLGDSLKEARDRAYAAVGRVRFEGMVFRRDIGVRGLARLSRSYNQGCPRG